MGSEGLSGSVGQSFDDPKLLRRLLLVPPDHRVAWIFPTEYMQKNDLQFCKLHVTGAW